MSPSRFVALLLVAAALPAAAPAQQRRQPQRAAEQARDTMPRPAPNRESPSDTTVQRVTTQHSVVIGGQRIEYDATVGDIILRDSANEPIGALYFTAYIKRGVTDPSHRPITFAYNGGPGSSSVWVHMGAFGPKRVVTPDTTHAPPPPYQLVDNAYSPLDKTDLVFIDPIGTGFSHPLGKATGKMFWGVDEDVRSLSQFISRYLTEQDRWNSPRYLLGESYGTTRSAALVNYLQQADNMDFNGVILMSSVLDFQTITFDPGNLMPYVLYLPSYAAVAWYHKVLPDQPAQLRPFLKEVEHFATTDYLHALMQGDDLPPDERARIIEQLHKYTGLDTGYIDRANLQVDAPEFEKELLREHGEVIGRLDARFTGPTFDMLAQRSPYDPQSSSISSAFVSTFQTYLHTDLNFPRDKQYMVSGNVNPWNWQHGRRGGWPGHTNVAVDIAQALQLNPHLHVLLNSGLFDLATPYYAAEWTFDQMDLPKNLRGHVQFAEYDAGHMMYVYEPSLAKLKENIASFIDATSGVNGTAGRVATSTSK